MSSNGEMKMSLREMTFILLNSLSCLRHIGDLHSHGEDA